MSEKKPLSYYYFRNKMEDTIVKGKSPGKWNWKLSVK